MICGNCPACLDRTNAILSAPAPRPKPAGPTAEQLHRHAERFGPELVKETAKELGVDLRLRKVEPKPKRQRRTGPSLREQVAELHGRGMMPAAIADVCNISDRRAAELIRELDARAAA